VVDPTRWVFEASDPYIYIGGPNDQFDIQPCADCGLLDEEHDLVPDACFEYTKPQWPYDEGGNALRSATQTPPPGPNDTRMAHLPNEKLALEGDALKHVQMLLKDPGNEVFRPIQIHWLGNLSYDLLGPHVKAIYEAITEVGYGASIPIDNKQRARRG
jgi:hypothetical protein